jgi:hypothetical protein
MFLTKKRVKSVAIRSLLATLFVIVVLLLSRNTSANDLGLRASGQINYKHFGGGVTKLSQEHRFDLEELALNEVFTDLGFHYRLAGWLTTGASYRMVFAEKQDSWKLEHRPHADVVVTARRLFYLDLTWRARLEYRIRGEDLSVRVRKRLKTTFKRVPMKPFVAAEVFLPYTGTPERTRAFLGFSPLENLSTFYLLEADHDQGTEFKNIVGINYKFNL